MNDLFAEMQRLRLLAGQPSLRKIGKAVGISPTTAHEALRGPRASRWTIYEVIVKYLDGDPELVRALWVAAVDKDKVASARYQPRAIQLVDIDVTTSQAEGRRYATWRGDPGWISMPADGDRWAHCGGWGGWGGESFKRVWWNGPGGETETAHTVEIEVTNQVFEHLLAEHGFIEP